MRTTQHNTTQISSTKYRSCKDYRQENCPSQRTSGRVAKCYQRWKRI